MESKCAAVERRCETKADVKAEPEANAEDGSRRRSRGGSYDEPAKMNERHKTSRSDVEYREWLQFQYSINDMKPP
ncbi:MAG TPA: hypothetical protein O0X97_05960 [Methanocorpusculum sp.]|nr:hypothetical protein [Methanocorpusculum sp.]